MTVIPEPSTRPTSHEAIAAWVAEVARLTRPISIQWCTGSDEEWQQMTDGLVESGTFVRFNAETRPDSF